MSLYKNYPDHSAGMSTALWNSCPKQMLQSDPGTGFFRIWTGKDILQNGSLLEMSGWKQTLQSDGGGGTSTATVLAAHRGGYVMTCDNAQDDGVNSQLVGEGLDLQSARGVWIEARVKVDAVTQYQLALGLATTDTTVIASGALACTEFSGYLALVTASNSVVNLVNQTGGTGAETTALTDSTTALLTADTYVQLGLWWNRDGVRTYINGNPDVGNGGSGADYPTGVVVPTFWFGANTTTARVFTMPWIAVAAEY
jgi:hypothetical protein